MELKKISFYILFMLLIVGLVINGLNLVGLLISMTLTIYYLYEAMKNKLIINLALLFIFIINFFFLSYIEKEMLWIIKLIIVIIIITITLLKINNNIITSFLIVLNLNLCINLLYKNDIIEIITVCLLFIISINIIKKDKKNWFLEQRYFELMNSLILCFLYLNNVILITKAAKKNVYYIIDFQDILIPFAVSNLIYLCIYLYIKNQKTHETIDKASL